MSKKKSKSKKSPTQPLPPDPNELTREILRALVGDEGLSDEQVDQYKEKTLSEILEIDELEQNIGVAPGFFEQLLNETSDWAFAIKLHALMEAAVGHLLIEHFADKGLREFFARLEMNNPTTGKATLALAVGRLDPIVKKYIQQLSEIRNRYAHDVRTLNLSLAELVGELKRPPGAIKASICLSVNDKSRINWRMSAEGFYPRLSFHQIFAVSSYDISLRLACWISASYCLHQINNNAQRAKLDRDLNELNAKVLDRLLEVAERRAGKELRNAAAETAVAEQE